MIKKSANYLIISLLSVLGGLFLLAWAMQTVWIASFPDVENSKYKLWFYLQLAGSIFCFSVGVLACWRWWISTKK